MLTFAKSKLFKTSFISPNRCRFGYNYLVLHV